MGIIERKLKFDGGYKLLWWIDGNIGYLGFFNGYVPRRKVTLFLMGTFF